MNERDELATVIHRSICEDSLSECLEDEGYCVKAANEILAAGYSKPRTITLWGASFVHNGAFFREYPTREDAQAFVDEMGEVGAHLVVVTREHTPTVYSEWVAA